MIYLLRIKGVSECFGIRRDSLSYCIYGNGTVDLSREPHPINVFGSLTIDGDEVTVQELKEKMIPGEEKYFSFGHKVASSQGEVIERTELRLMVMPLAKEAIDYYKKAIEDGYYFDSWNGEFEYIIGMIEELVCNDLVNAAEWYDKAEKKHFNFKLIRRVN